MNIGEVELKERDAVKILGKEKLTIATATGTHLLAIEMATDQGRIKIKVLLS